MASIRSFGYNVPVIVDGQRTILAGHGRVEAARRLGLSQVPIIEIGHLSEAERRAFMLADNRLNELSSWDEEILALELEEIALSDAPFEITDTGFDLELVDRLVEDRHKKGADEVSQDLPIARGSVPKVARLGDLWLMGRHRLFVGNALEEESYRVLLDHEKAQMVFADAPFNVKIRGHVSGQQDAREFVMGSGEMDRDTFKAFLRRAFDQMARFSEDGSIHYQCMDWRGLKVLLEAGEEVYDELKNICCWVKHQGGMGSLYRSQHEMVAVFKRGRAPHINNVALGKHGRNRTNVWSIAGMNSFQKDRAEKLSWHPTVKPVSLVADAMLDCSRRGGLVLDPFAGSGTTAIAAERTGRRAALMELDPLYADVILHRFVSVTGIEVVNAATGQIVRAAGQEEWAA
ncbi:site-specific DNA-methyltransferase [Altererythrobacter sp. Z27]|uniref:site-specific DNA-methyltransferase n=1 Tax=Altererythrobacter sp. Z27 TaxID=3461147 RepID=UPI0040450376